MSLVLIAALPFLGAVLPGLLIRLGRTAAALAAGAVTLTALILLAAEAPSVLAGGVVKAQIDWLPALGLNANFFLDGLSLFFAGLILGMGLLVILYARFYLSDRDPLGRFYGFLLMFQGAMLGIVLSDNILLLLIFWELTSLTSFLLIGFWKDRAESRQGARMALAVTGGGGLCLIAGMLILGQAAGGHDLTTILTAKAAIWGSGLYLPALILILIGAFAKSAQFPFHFWLPHAMAAPTPVSAYLHSATMVKAGIYLMIRLWPVMSGTFEWFALLVGTGLFTLLLGAWVALWKDDLKAILAYSTISHLGLITLLIGLGSESALVAALFHILCHATFKAALFLSAGIIDHETGTRDITRLGGLRRLMPISFGITAIAGLSMAGFPPLNGFLSKELFLAETTQVLWPNPWIVAVLATVGAALSVGYALRLLVKGFLGPVRADYPHQPHDPTPGLWAAPALLASLVVLIGLFPNLTTRWLLHPAASAASRRDVFPNIALWHGLEVPELWMSLAGIGGGLMLLGGYPALRALRDRMPRLDAKRMFDAVVNPLAADARKVTDALHNGSFTRMLVLALLVLLAATGFAWFSGTHDIGTRPTLTMQPLMAAICGVLALASLAAAALHRNRLLALILTGVVGLLIAPIFAIFSAPDLALTQVAVEVVTVLLMLLALRFLPKATPAETPLPRRLFDVILAATAGLGMAALAYAMLTRAPAFPPISDFHLEQSKPGAGGTNAVNTIIVDFRGFDTFGEIIVLGIAALIIFALSQTLLKSPAVSHKLAALPPPAAGDPHPMMLVSGVRVLLPMALLFAAYLFLRGHNLPGGGFVAGLVVAAALLLQYLGSGYDFSQSRQRRDHHVVIAAGVLVALLAGIGPWVMGLPFLTSGFTYVDLPPLDKFELASAMIFDLGVFLCVLGAVLLALDSLAGLARVDRPDPRPKKGRKR